MAKWISNLLIVIGVICLGVFGWQVYQQHQNQSVTTAEAEVAIEEQKTELDDSFDVMAFQPDLHEAFGILHVPKLDRSIGVVEGTDPDALSQGVGHVSSTAFPGQGEQIVFSGHRDTVFRNFADLEIGDRFEVEMPYGDFEYEIEDFEIVDAENTTVIGEMGEEVLVVTTCYPFEMLGSAPERAVFYAWPVEE